MICGNLVEEICSGISQKAVVMTWLEEMLDRTWVEVQARKIWSMMERSQPIQVRVLGMVERQGLEAAKIEMVRRKAERLAKNVRVKEYWRGWRVDIQLEEVRDRVTALNLLTEWVDVKMMDNEEMDEMMDVTGAVVDMEESNLSLGKEEHWMDEMMMSVIDNLGVIETTHLFPAISGKESNRFGSVDPENLRIWFLKISRKFSCFFKRILPL